MAGGNARGLRWWPPELRHPLFLALAALYLLARLARYGHTWALPAPLNSHFADVLALPLLLTVALSFMRRLYFRQPTFVLPGSWVVSTWLSVALVFEVLLPRFRPRTYTADWLDIVAYGLGGLIFWRWLNCPASR
ncbi:hypothetical protein [Hymenobacter yonginensis]|uniref:Magnesium citrate secondary transporter n=1 Tax=Hymenobacter yonginensis TaxID=748197 RepID=A0ABY7PU06_9BACT|nr:hypothetical protein [Hymenobacter yonginensis]WBO86387.1 hypothetical protein O9Z63_09020 [Hymenobacter yonginensis]